MSGPYRQAERQAHLATLARGLRRWDVAVQDITDHLVSVNKRECDPPLDESEVRRIAANGESTPDTLDALTRPSMPAAPASSTTAAAPAGSPSPAAPPPAVQAASKRPAKANGGGPVPNSTANTPLADRDYQAGRSEDVVVHADFLEHAVEQALAAGATEDQVALAFAVQNRERLRFNHRRQLWYAWDGTRWREETTELALEYARRLARRANREGRIGPARASFARGVEALARADRALAMRGDEFDRDVYLLNTPAGTINLRTGEMQPHRREELITMCTAVAPGDKAAPTFANFIKDITCGDQALADYLQQALGATLSGAPQDHWLMFWHGAGRNGKSTLGEIVMHTMGDYARKIPAQTLLADRHGNRHPTEIANLLGIRLAVSSEVSEGDHFDEARIKELTGDATLSARFVRRDFFEFKRTHKHLIYGNHRPLLRVVDPAIAQRLHVVPFNASFTAESGNLDTQMAEKLRAEAPAILHWLVVGHECWRERGALVPCEAVAAATKDYFDSQSTLDMWAEERAELVPNDERPWDLLDRAADLYKDYKLWKEARGEYALSTTRWGEQMNRRFGRERRAAGVRYRGLQLLRNVGT